MYFKEENKYTCQYCGKRITGANIKRHEKICPSNPNRELNYKEQRLDEREEKRKKYRNDAGKYVCPKCGKEYDSYFGLSSHMTLCGNEELKKRISKKVSQAQKDGRLHDIGTKRRQHKSSYAEEFIERVIANEFTDKNYLRELKFGKYWLDFAWPHLKKCIEVDGQQHYYYPDYQERDKRKDAFIRENGWEVLRIKFSDMFKATKEYIKIMMDFIDSNIPLGEVDLSDAKEKVQKALALKKKEKTKSVFSKDKVNLYTDVKVMEKNKDKVERITNMILNSGLDFSARDWMKKATELTGIQNISRWMKKYMPEFYEKNCYNRYPNGVRGHAKKGHHTMNNVMQRAKAIAIVRKLKNSGIDFSKYGWVDKAKQIIGQYNVARWMREHMPKFYEENCYKRGTDIPEGRKYHKPKELKGKRLERWKKISAIHRIRTANIDFTEKGWREKVNEIYGGNGGVRFMQEYMRKFCEEHNLTPPRYRKQDT